MTRAVGARFAALKAWALASFPGAHRKSPWPNHDDLAVRDKTFAYLSVDPPYTIGCKLPHSNALALELPGASPTGYGLGRSGWVTLRVDDVDSLPEGMLEAWLEESYRAQAPKTLVKELDARSAASSAVRPPGERAKTSRR